MNFELFKNVKNNIGETCTAAMFQAMMDSENVRKCAGMLQDPNLTQNQRQELKSKMLPVVTWQASFKDHKRSNANAIPSGLYMLDIDHCKDRMREIITKAKEIQTDCGIVYIGRSISGEGVRIVAECQPQFRSIAECQQWLAGKLGVEFDSACKDWARASYLVPFEYVHYFDGSIFEREPKCLYDTQNVAEISPKDNEIVAEGNEIVSEADENNEVLCFKGIPYSEIIDQYWTVSGEDHGEGYRNTALYKLAFGLRYICDFNEQLIRKVIPTLGLPENEVAQLVHSACVAPRSGEMPKTLRKAVDTLLQLKKFDEESNVAEDMPEVEKFADVFSIDEVPALPPIFKEWFDIAPDDYKLAVVLTLLPFLGTVGSRLRAEYFNGEIHSPSFLCCVEAPQANGKSFVRKLDQCILGELKAHDAEEREKERAWKEARRFERDSHVKMSKEDLQVVMEQKPEGLIRYVAPTISITELLRKMVSAKGLHVMAVSEEIDTVHKAMKRGFSDFSDLLRKAFDNAEHGQDYASEQSWSGIVKLFFNTVYCGTPRAVRRFFPDVEDGMVSRVIFVTFPDQSFKPVPVWGSFNKAQEANIRLHLQRLNMISLVDGEVQEEHLMKMGFMVKEMDRWCRAQQRYAAAQKDITRDTFCRRSAVIGFRAAMIAHFLWGEKDTPATKAKVKQFGVWVANCCLRQFLMRFDLNNISKDGLRFQTVYDELPDEFDKTRLVATLSANGIRTEVRNVIYRWKLAGAIVKTEDKHTCKTFRKVKEGAFDVAV